MGFKVGMPTLELKTNAKAAARCKKGGVGRSICVEAGEERYSKTQNYDPSRSGANVHLGPYASGDDAWAYIKGQLDEIEATRKAAGKRAIRKDATVAHALIVKPDGEWANAQTPEELDRFFADAADVLDALGVVPKESVVMRERHLDEGFSADEPCAHEHYVFMARTPDGDLAGSRHLGLGAFHKLNRDFPRMMRERGWDCEELVGYDVEATKNMSDEELAAYKKQHREAKLEHGLSANEYIAHRKVERAEKRAEAAEKKAILRERANAAIKADSDAAWDRMTAAKAEQAKAEQARDEAAAELAEMEPRIKAVGKREADVKAREESAKRREERAADDERRAAATRREADDVLACARRDAEAMRDEAEEEARAAAQEAAERTRAQAAAEAAGLIDEARALREKERADDVLTRFARWCRSQGDRGFARRVAELVESFRADDAREVSARERADARLRSQVDDIQRRRRERGGYDY